MKRLMILVVLGCVSLIGSITTTAKAEPPADVGIGVSFYSSLAPYGEWVDCNFGYAWRPTHVVHGWRPYMYGRWAWTDYGWYWLSNEPFGWATFHYGRWVYDDYYGWIWIPGDQWGPAWVEWRYDNDYIGWAPLSPYATFSVNIGVTFTSGWVSPIYYWNFVPCRYFTTTRIVDYVQPLERTRRIFGSTRGVRDIRYVDNRIFNRGVDVTFVERRANTRISRVNVVGQDRSNRGDRLIRTNGREVIEAYQPRIEGSVRSTDRNRLGTSEPSRSTGSERGATVGQNPSARPDVGSRSGSTRGTIQEPSTIRQRGVDQVRPPDVQRETRRDNSVNQPESDQRARWQQQRELRDRQQQQTQEERMRQRQANQQRPRETPRSYERPPRRESVRQQPATRERQPSRSSGTQSRGGRDGRHRN